MKKFRMLIITTLFLFITIPVINANAAESDYITIGGVKLQAESIFNDVYALTDEEGNITTEGATADNYNISFNSFRDKLILNDATIKAADCHAVYYESGITIEGKGKNTVISLSSEGTDTFKGIYAKGSITISGEIEEISAFGDAIYATSEIKITGKIEKISSKKTGIYTTSGKIEIPGSITEINSGCNGIFAKSGAVIIKGSIGKINNTITYKKGIFETCGIYAGYNNIEISGSVGDITVIAASTVQYRTDIFGLKSKEGDIKLEGTTGNITVYFDPQLDVSYTGDCVGIYADNIEINGTAGDMTCDFTALHAREKITVNGSVGNITCKAIDRKSQSTIDAALYADGGLYKNTNAITVNGSVGNISITVAGECSDYTVYGILTTNFMNYGTIGNISGTHYGIMSTYITFGPKSKTGNISGETYSMGSNDSLEVYGEIGKIGKLNSYTFYTYKGSSIESISKLFATGVSIGGKTGDIGIISSNGSVSVTETGSVGNIPLGITAEKSVSLSGTTGSIGGVSCFNALSVSGNVKSIFGSPAILAYGGIKLSNNTVITSPANAVIKQADPTSYNMLWYTVFDGDEIARVVEFGKKPSELTVVRGSGSGEYLPGTEISISVNKYCSAFKEWQFPEDVFTTKGDKNSTSAVIIMPNRDVSVYAVFEEIDESRHTLTKIEGKDATCTENGYMEYYRCSCGLYYSDKNRTQTITDVNKWKTADGTIKANGHNFFFSWSTEVRGSDTENGLEKNACIDCDYAEHRVIMTRKYAFGDVNLDGAVTAADARLALRISVNLEHPESKKIKQADYNEDDTVTAADARLILRLSVKLEKEKTIEYKYAILPNLKEPVYK